MSSIVQKILPVSCVMIILSFSCHPSNTHNSKTVPIIRYWTSGGFVGGTHPTLVIYSDRTAINTEGYPEVSGKLSDKEYDDLLKTFSGFYSLADNYAPVGIWCADDVVQHIEYIKDGKLLQASVAGCTMNENPVRPPIAILWKIVNKLRDIADSIYNNQLPWKGVTVSFSVDKLVYGLDQPVRALFTIVNPTDYNRKLYFRHNQQYSFSVSHNSPHFHYEYPPYGMIDSGGPSEIALSPHEKKEIAHVFSPREVFGSQFIPGRYGIFMRLLVGRYENDYETSESIPFEIADLK